MIRRGSARGKAGLLRGELARPAHAPRTSAGRPQGRLTAGKDTGDPLVVEARSLPAGDRCLIAIGSP